MSGRGKPHGPADQKNAQTVDERTVRKYDAVVQHLLKLPNLEKETLCSSEACAKIVAQIQIFMDQKLGYKAKSEDRFMTKIPAKLFRDYTEGGSLECILHLALQFRHDMQMMDGSVLRRFELLSEKQKLCARSLCMRLRDGLKDAGFWKAPVVYLWEDISADLMERLRDIVMKHEGVVSTDIKSASHIVLHYAAKDAEDNETYAREILREGNRSFAHWWYFPESWDCWTSALATTPEQESQAVDIPPDGKWKVGYDWLLDLDTYNEWMCELDYEIFDHPPRLLEAFAAADGGFTLASSKAISKNRRSFRRKVKHTTVYESGETPSEDTEIGRNSSVSPNELSSGIYPSPSSSSRLPTKLDIGSPSVSSGSSSTLRNVSTNPFPVSPHSGLSSGTFTRSLTKEGNISSPFHASTSPSPLPTAASSARFPSRGSPTAYVRDDSHVSPPLIDGTPTGTSSFSPTPAFSASEEDGTESPTSKRKRLLPQEESAAGSLVEGMPASVEISPGSAFGTLPPSYARLPPVAPSCDSPEISSSAAFSGEKHTKRARYMNASPSLVSTNENEEIGPTYIEIMDPPSTHTQTVTSRSYSNPVGDTILTRQFLVSPPSMVAPVRSVPLSEGGVSIAALQDLQSLAVESATAYAETVIKDTQKMPPLSPQELVVNGKQEELASANIFLSEKEDEATPSHTGKGTDSFPLSPTKQQASPPGSLGEVVKQPALENLLSSSSLLLRDRVTLLNISNLSQESTTQGMLLKTIPLGTPPDRPPPAEIEEKSKEMDKFLSTEEAGVGTPIPLEAPTSLYVLPTCSRWFDSHVVNAIERNQLSSLFSGSGLSLKEKEHSYKLIRNTIVAAYRQNPQRYLSATECRKLIDGDAALILRLHSFLDYWGIINFQADPSTIPYTHLRNKDFQLSQTNLSPGIPRETVPTTLSQKLNHGLSLPPASNLTSASQNILQDVRLGKSPPHRGGGPWKCASCGKLCLYSYYVLRPSDVTGISLGVLDKCVWCLKCFSDGRYPPVLTERHFLKVDIPIAQATGIDGEWSAKEVEKLIEGIELFKDNWEAVARHIGTGKTPHQCVSFFISIPIKEPFMSASASQDPLSSVPVTKTIPFRTMSNPLMAQLAFLASIVHPKVAACAAKAAFDSLVEAGCSPREGAPLLGEPPGLGEDASLPSASPSPISLTKLHSQDPFAHCKEKEGISGVDTSAPQKKGLAEKDEPLASSGSPSGLPDGYLTDVDIQVELRERVSVFYRKKDLVSVCSVG
ncbi:SWIRM domain-containing protein [Cardiosporidium cionae]|uniref:SWIRM domain-containing protein n=1 Tax=Cardiosporidium cionae TaxID=476202 RepID=A0ABQ7J6T6_9APIC|nr:SWIRM domain-containing protein [Cardiosporidium cionae]|eukprot:KAF8819698.1 SWIRM domain-containing protein [Cardiosporidium cionae]